MDGGTVFGRNNKNLKIIKNDKEHGIVEIMITYFLRRQHTHILEIDRYE